FYCLSLPTRKGGVHTISLVDDNNDVRPITAAEAHVVLVLGSTVGLMPAFTAPARATLGSVCIFYVVRRRSSVRITAP
ncbi:hypothetical protein, partial [Trinickia soli]|uniref:hypothetical protein n=1 Tax=Trinickia soli TaxID=380675 RepID=UPI003FA39318